MYSSVQWDPSRRQYYASVSIDGQEQIVWFEKSVGDRQDSERTNATTYSTSSVSEQQNSERTNDTAYSTSSDVNQNQQYSHKREGGDPAIAPPSQPNIVHPQLQNSRPKSLHDVLRELAENPEVGDVDVGRRAESNPDNTDSAVEQGIEDGEYLSPSEGQESDFDPNEFSGDEASDDFDHGCSAISADHDVNENITDLLAELNSSNFLEADEALREALRIIGAVQSTLNEDEDLDSRDPIQTLNNDALNGHTQSVRSESIFSSDTEEFEKNKLKPALDPALHFASLDSLELRMAFMCQLENFSKDDIRISCSMDVGQALLERQNDLESILAGLEVLEEDEFCQSQISIMVQDTRRKVDSTIVPVAKVVMIHKNLLESILNLCIQARATTQSDKSHDNTYEANIDAYTDKLAQELRASGLQGVLDVIFKNYDNCFVELLTLSCAIFKFALVSYSASHCCPFDETVFCRTISSFDFGDHCALRRRRLKCLDKFIGGPVWILETEDVHEQEYLLSITAEQFSDLWGPVWLVPGTEERPAPTSIFMERGVIQPETTDLTEHGEIQCHYYSSRDETRPQGPVSMVFETSARLLIGMNQTRRQDALNSCFIIDPECDGNVARTRQQNSHMFQIAGAHNDYWQLDQYQIAMNTGYHVNVQGQKTYKRTPATTAKDIILKQVMAPDVNYLPLLNNKYGLEVSSCTFNTQRITLWEALTLANLGTKPSPHDPRCRRRTGSYTCISRCWNFVPDDDETDVRKLVKRAILRSLRDLLSTGLDKTDTFQVWWPFGDKSETLSIGSRKVHSWIDFVKDSKYVATFAVMSNLCLAYHYTKHGSCERLRLWRGCTSRNMDRIEAKKSGCEIQRTLLSTALQLHPHYSFDRQYIYGDSCLISPLPPGTLLGVELIGYLKIRYWGSRGGPLAKLRLGTIQKIRDKVANLASDNMHREHYNNDENPGRFLPLFVY